MNGQWVKGYNGGLTGPNTPWQPTVHHSIACRRWANDSAPYPKDEDYFIPIACGHDTVAIAVGPDREATADLTIRAQGMKAALQRIQSVAGNASEDYNTPAMRKIYQITKEVL